jgi:DNA-binding NtrC family response regulator
MLDGIKILIVEDNTMMIDILSKGLSRRGLGCVTALNAEEALKELKADRFDIMVTDVIMPGIDGFELTRMTKKLYPEMPVIIITGFGNEKSYDMAMEAEASDFINKPFSLSELITRMEHVIRNERLISEIKRKHEELQDISNEMISGIQDESSERIEELNREISNLKKKVAKGGCPPDKP